MIAITSNNAEISNTEACHELIDHNKPIKCPECEYCIESFFMKVHLANKHGIIKHQLQISDNITKGKATKSLEVVCKNE